MVIKIIKMILAIALVGGLLLAGWRVYRRLPDDAAGNARASKDFENGIAVTIVLGEGIQVPVKGTVEVYAIDFAAVQRDYDASPLQQKHFETFLNRRLRDLEPVRARFEDRRATVKLNRGNCWIRATAEMPYGEIFEWRVPVVVNSPGQTVELTAENAYEKTKKF